jgi:hypothetical protein
MPRPRVSQADEKLIASAASRGFTVTARRIERWREQRLLPPNSRRFLGRGRGSTSEPAPGAAELVVWLAEHARPGRRPSDLALLAFGAGLAVPEAGVRAAFVGAANRVELSVERDMPLGSAPEDVADAAVTAGLRATMVPARIRRIDKALARLGVNWAPPELTALDPGAMTDPVTGNDWTYTAVQVFMTGGGEVDLGMLGGAARAMAPTGAAAPVARAMEGRWPDNEEQADSLLNEDGGLDFLPTGDVREHLRDLADSTPIRELLDAWRMAAQMPQWATNLCDAVEHEIAERQPGEAMMEWCYGAFGPPRLMLAMALRDRKARPADTATTALLLLLVRNMIRLLRQRMPTGQFNLLAHPMVTPSFLVPFIDD